MTQPAQSWTLLLHRASELVGLVLGWYTQTVLLFQEAENFFFFSLLVIVSVKVSDSERLGKNLSLNQIVTKAGPGLIPC